MAVNDALGTRMKEFYEQVPKTRLTRRTPVAIRLDGKAFHTFTRGFIRPFDPILMTTMQNTMKYLCENIQGCVFGYTQSDEITLILIDYQTFNTDAWFNYEVQKMCSISASMATLAFNKYFPLAIEDRKAYITLRDLFKSEDNKKTSIEETYKKALNRGAMFDSRCFNIPKEEVANLIYWRQLDASRNSIQMVGQANFSQAELEGKSCNDIQDMLMLQKGINWNDFPTYCKRGSCCIRVPGEPIITETVSNDSWSEDVYKKVSRYWNWQIDLDIPIFKGEDRNYIEQFIYVGEGL